MQTHPYIIQARSESGHHAIFVDERNDGVYRLNHSGTRLWDLLGTAGSWQSAFEAYAADRSSDLSAARTEALEFLSGLITAGVVYCVSTPPDMTAVDGGSASVGPEATRRGKRREDDGEPIMASNDGVSG